ncbi:lymphoid-specific helicase [Limosa lapponica baueri]|uniref:Lymphoid-specific helicase n=1 Tax=Limosa lapponica baueri TaxID=1758121 RepID=A0A2I0TAK0_LIMLA|nr:lymphoid-specific helicase [Limosa lapponica baueri]
MFLPGFGKICIFSRPVVEVSIPMDSEVNLKLQNIMMLLRKCCNHPYLIEYPLDPATQQFKVDEDLVKNSGKFLLLDRMLPELKKRGHKVLLFSQMTLMLDILMDYCYLRDFKFSRLDGSMSYSEREENMHQFNTDPEVFLFLVSTRAGGLGINLTAADTVIIYDSDWNPQSDLQAQDRCHRIGQTKPVVVYRLVTANTIDQKIVERAAAKRKLEKLIIHKNQFKGGKSGLTQSKSCLDPQELLELLKSRDYEREVKGSKEKVISDKDLELLLDRSDLIGNKHQGDVFSQSSVCDHWGPEGTPGGCGNGKHRCGPLIMKPDAEEAALGDRPPVPAMVCGLAVPSWPLLGASRQTGNL